MEEWERVIESDRWVIKSGRGATFRKIIGGKKQSGRGSSKLVGESKLTKKWYGAVKCL